MKLNSVKEVMLNECFEKMIDIYHLIYRNPKGDKNYEQPNEQTFEESI